MVRRDVCGMQDCWNCMTVEEAVVAALVVVAAAAISVGVVSCQRSRRDVSWDVGRVG